MRVLVTGHRGYVGSVLCRVLQNANFDVVGLDVDLYGDCDFGRTQDAVPFFDIDIRDVEYTELLSFDAIIHLAALSDDPLADISPKHTQEINIEGTNRLAECAKRAGVERFLFASSCSVYGRGGNDLLTEESPVAPLSRYAQSKLDCENILRRMSSTLFTPISLRMPTCYGASSRIRLDLVVNDFVGSAVANRHIMMQSAGVAWRPMMHVEDVSRAYAGVLTAPTERIANQVFNIADSEQNFRVIEIADAVTEEIEQATRMIAKDAIDERSYRVDGAKLAKTLPNLQYRWNLVKGIRQLRSAMTSAGLTPGDWRSDRYRRAHRLRGRIERNELNAKLRPTASSVPALCY